MINRDYPVDCGVADSCSVYNGKLPKGFAYIGNCIDTVDELEYWDTQEMSDCLYNSEIIPDNNLLSSYKFNVELNDNCYCGINIDMSIFWIYNEEEDIHYFYDFDGIGLNECEGMEGCCHLNPNMNVGGMGEITLPHDGQPGSGDLPMPSGKLYKQVMPFDSFVRVPKHKKRKRKLEKHSDAEHTPNAPMYDYVDDFRTYVKRTYKQF